MNFAILVFINLIYAGAPTMLKVSAAEFPPETLVWLRHTIALLILLPFARFARWPRMSLHTLSHIAIATLLAFTITSLLQIIAIQRSSASVGAMVVAMQPIITIGLAGFFLREKLSIRLWSACVTALLGFAILSGDGILQLQGNLLFVLAIACESTLGIFLRPLLKDHSPMQITVSCLSCASLFLLPLQFDVLPAFQQASPAAWAGVVYLALGCSATGTLLWLVSLQKLQVSRAAIAWFLQPLWGSVLPVLVLGESISANSIFGGVLILTAMGIILWQGHGTSPRPTGRLAALKPSH